MILLFGSIKTIGQNDSYVSRFLETQYQYTTNYYDSIEITKCPNNLFPCLEFKGKLVPAISYLWKKDSAFVRTIGKIPNAKLYYFIKSINCSDRDELVEMLKIKMQKDYHFTTTLYQDSAEVLSLEIIDPVKLQKFESHPISDDYDSFTKYNNEQGYFELNNSIFVNLTNIFKKNLSNNKLYSQVDEFKEYCIRIPNPIVETNSITIINQYLTENLGLELKKEKRLEEFLLLEFTK